MEDGSVASPVEPTDAAWRSPLAGVAGTTTRAADGASKGVVVAERRPGLMLQVIARRGMRDQVTRQLGDALGMAVPATPRCVFGRSASVAWSGPGQWLVMAQGADIEAARERTAAAITGAAALVEQSDSRVRTSLSGPRVRDALAKLVSIDLHPGVFGIGGAAMTAIAHIPLHIWRCHDEGGNAVFEIAAPQSYAGSLWHHIVVAAAEYGLEARTLQPDAATR
jgi:sarcosine oxidase subunit gamma